MSTLPETIAGILKSSPDALIVCHVGPDGDCLGGALALALEFVSPVDADPSTQGEIARHAEQAGDQEIAYRHALQASESCTRRGAYEEALSWLDLAAGMSTRAEESEVVNRATARVLEEAGWHEAPPIRPIGSLLLAPMQPEDLDLPTGV